MRRDGIQRLFSTALLVLCLFVRMLPAGPAASHGTNSAFAIEKRVVPTNLSSLTGAKSQRADSGDPNTFSPGPARAATAATLRFAGKAHTSPHAPVSLWNPESGHGRSLLFTSSFSIFR
jgi:hypothetical protein